MVKHLLQDLFRTVTPGRAISYNVVVMKLPNCLRSYLLRTLGLAVFTDAIALDISPALPKVNLNMRDRMSHVVSKGGNPNNHSTNDFAVTRLYLARSRERLATDGRNRKYAPKRLAQSIKVLGLLANTNEVSFHIVFSS